MSKITLNGVGNIIDATTAATTINNNNTVIQTAMDNTLSRDGISPNQMAASLDMNSNQIINLPTPATAFSPVRLQDVQTGGTITNIPAGGTTGQVLAKTSNSDYAVNWTSESAELTAGTNIVLTGTTPTTIATTTTPIFTTVNTATIPTVVDTLVGKNTTDTLTNKTLTTPVLNTATLNTPVISTITNTGTLTLPTSTDTLIGKATTDILTNKTLDTAGTGNVFKINGVTISANTGTGSNVLATTPTLVTPVLGAATATTINGSTVSPGHYSGEPSTGSASAGEIGEYIESVLGAGSATALTTNVAKTITSISLTAGDWDVDGSVGFAPTATTSVNATFASLSLSTNTLDTTLGRTGGGGFGAFVSGGSNFFSSVQPVRFSVSGATTVFLVGQSGFSVSTLSGYGIIRARRIR